MENNNPTNTPPVPELTIEERYRQALSEACEVIFKVFKSDYEDFRYKTYTSEATKVGEIDSTGKKITTVALNFTELNIDKKPGPTPAKTSWIVELVSTPTYIKAEIHQTINRQDRIWTRYFPNDAFPELIRSLENMKQWYVLKIEMQPLQQENETLRRENQALRDQAAQAEAELQELRQLRQAMTSLVITSDKVKND